MNILTQLTQIKVDGFANYITVDRNIDMIDLINRLGEIEDILEKYNIKNLNDLDKIIKKGKENE